MGLGTGILITPVSGAGGGAGPVAADFTIWNPDAPPVAAGALDDEFADASGGVPVGWTEFDPAAQTVPVEGENGLYMTQATHANPAINGIYKTDPTGAITIYAKVALSALNANSGRAGIALWDDATNTAEDIVTFQLEYVAGGVRRLAVMLWTNYTTFASQYGNVMAMSGTHAYLRVRRTGTTYNFEYSTNGLGWEPVYSGTIAFVPNQVGVFVDNSATGGDVRGFHQFFRSVASDVGLTGIMAGDRVNGWRA